MKPEVKAAWVKWLREHPDRQGFGQLKSRDGKVCVLGALCEVATEHGLSLVYRELADVVSIDGHILDLPGPVANWADLYDRRVKFGEGAALLCSLNDIGRLTFSQLADLIEEQK